MKKTKLFAMAILAMGMCVNLTSCNDDDDKSGSLNSSASILPTDEGDFVMTSNGSYSFSYDSDGKCTKAGYYDLSDPSKVIYDDEDEISLSFNGDGYIKNYKENFDDGSINMSVSYNGDKQISQVTYKETGEDYEISESVSFEYSDGTLKSVTANSVWKEDGYDDDSYNMTFTFTASSVDNEYQQITNSNFYLPYKDDLICYMCLEPFAYVGWYGKGSKKLFSDFEIKFGSGSTYSYDVSFTLNDNKTIATEKINSKTYSYYYDELGSSSKSVENKSIVETPEVERQSREEHHTRRYHHMAE